MKKVGKIIGLVILVMFVIAMIRVLPQAILDSSYNDIMKTLDMSSAKGERIAGYEVKEDNYTIQYVPDDLLAKKQNQVGYILKITRGKTSQKYSDGGYAVFSKEGETLDVQLIECSTGKVIASEYFEAYFPERVEIDAKLTVNPTVVSDWVAQVYQQYTSGNQVNAGAGNHDHVWQDATCTAPKTCADCGATEGKALGHNFMPTVCTRCGMEASGQKQQTPAETKPAPTDHEAIAESLITGKWKLDFIMDGTTFETVPFEGELTFQLNKDHSAFITTPDEKYSYDWVYNYQYFEDDDPNKNVYSYLLIDDAGNEIYFYHYYDNTVSIVTWDYSVFFTR